MPGLGCGGIMLATESTRRAEWTCQRVLGPEFSHRCKLSVLSTWLTYHHIHPSTWITFAPIGWYQDADATSDSVDDVTGFLTFPDFTEQALAARFTPGYKLKDWNLDRTVSNDLVDFSLGRKNLETYDLGGCAGLCSSTPGCKAFNICESGLMVQMVAGCFLKRSLRGTPLTDNRLFQIINDPQAWRQAKVTMPNAPTRRR